MGLHDHPSGFLPGAEFGYDQITGNVTVSSGTEASGTTVITCAAHSFDGAPVLAHFFSPQITPGAGDAMVVNLFEASTQIGRLLWIQGSAAGQIHATSGFLRFTPTAGQHTYTVTSYRGSVNATIAAGAGGTGVFVPAFIRFTKA